MLVIFSKHVSSKKTATHNVFTINLEPLAFLALETKSPFSLRQLHPEHLDFIFKSLYLLKTIPSRNHWPLFFHLHLNPLLNSRELIHELLTVNGMYHVLYSDQWLAVTKKEMWVRITEPGLIRLVSSRCRYGPVHGRYTRRLAWTLLASSSLNLVHRLPNWRCWEPAWMQLLEWFTQRWLLSWCAPRVFTRDCK